MDLLKRVYAILPDKASDALPILAAAYGSACAAAGVSDQDAYEGLRLSLRSGRSIAARRLS